MRLESYAQELEDLILYSVLRDVPKGFYIDIGANDPTDISVTKFFYDRGWNGINIEPQANLCLLLEELRPRDINICAGCGKESGQMALMGKGYSATFSQKTASDGGFLDKKSTDMIKILTLSEVYNLYCPEKQPVHFCKIDVEGYEKEVLQGIKDWNTFRPWIYVIEATLPGTSIPCHESWEPILMKHDYTLAFTSGINRYYVDLRKKQFVARFLEVKPFLQQHELVVLKLQHLYIN